MLQKITFSIFACWAVIAASSCNSGQQAEKNTADSEQARIVSISGTTTEILCAAGLESNIVGTDVTSTYPEAMQQLPKVGHNRTMSSEAIIALKPTLVIGIEENTKPEIREQLAAAHIKVLLFKLESSVDGTKNLIRAITDSLGVADKAQPIVNTIDEDLKGKVALAKSPKVLFIYARGAGNIMAAGEHTYPNAMIQLAGGHNAMTGFEDFKPLTSEAVLAANPDVILMFTSGLQSLGGMEGLLQIPGVGQTNAGKNKQVIEMDGQFLTGFGPRLGKAITALSKKLNEVPAH